jgi:uncharacterized membrane protein YhaH (DUF805 family)
MTDEKTQKKIRNQRRVFLIDKKSKEGLSQAEEKELEELQAEYNKQLVKLSWLGNMVGFGVILLLLIPSLFIALLCFRFWQDSGLPTWLSVLLAVVFVIPLFWLCLLATRQEMQQ